MQREWPEHYAGGELAPEYYDDAVKRARAKLEEIRAGRVAMPPVGFVPYHAVLAAVFGGLPALALLYGAVSFVGERNGMPLVVLFTILAAPIALATVLAVLGSRPNTPKRALRLFYKTVGRGKGELARRLSVPNDFDTFPRYQPTIYGLGGSEAPFQFDDTKEFKHYWDTLVRQPTWPYCLSYVRNLRLRRVDDDVMLAEFRLTLMMNTRIWLLLAIPALLIAVIVDAATRKTIREPMSKLLVRTPDGEWRIFNAEWQGQEEEDPDWL